MRTTFEDVVKWAAAALVGAFLAVGGVYYSRGGQIASNKTVIRVWDWWSPAGYKEIGTYFNTIEHDFEERHPDIDIRYQFIPFGTQYTQKLMSAFAAGDPPDAFQCSVSWARDLYDRGIIADLNDFVATSPDVAMDQYFPITREYLAKDGRIFGVPTSMDSNCLILNAGLCRKAGLDPSPHAIDSWETFVAYAEKLTVRDEGGRILQAGFPVTAIAERSSEIWPWLASEGLSFYTDDMMSTNAATPQGIRAMQLLYDLLNVYKVSFPPGTEIQADNLFIEGKVGMLRGGTWMGYEIFQTAPDLDFVMTTFPPGPGSTERGAITWVNMMMMPKNCRHPKETWEYLRFYGGLENALNMLVILNRNSARLDFYDTPEWRAKVAEHPYLAMLPEISAAGRVAPYKRQQEMDEAFVPFYQRAVLGTMPIEEAMKEANARVEKVLEGSWADQLLREMDKRAEAGQ